MYVMTFMFSRLRLIVLLLSVVTPSDYEPPGFEPSEEGECMYNGTPMTITIGSVSTVSMLSLSFFRELM